MADASQLKVCSKCGESKPLSAFQRKPGGLYGVRADCKDCHNAQTRERRRATGHAISDHAREAKRARDRERAKKTDVRLRNAQSHARYRKTSSYAKVVSAAKERRVEQKIKARTGIYTEIAWRVCMCCGDSKWVVPGKGKLIETYCGPCAKKNGFTGKEHRPTERYCLDCNSLFVGKLNSKRCDPCNQLHLRAYRQKIKKVWGKTYKSRAKRYGCFYEPVNRVSVFKRDKWRCYVCGCQVIQSNEWVPNQATLDHIIPLSKGGPHAYVNVRTCCQLCNSTKRDKIESPIQLNIFHNTRGAIDP